MVPQGKNLLVAKRHKLTDLLCVEMVSGPEPLDIKIEMIFDFLGKLVNQEEVVIPACGGCMPEIIFFPEKHPLPQVINFLSPMLPGYFFRAWVRNHNTS
jgi:hypothetical protein